MTQTSNAVNYPDPFGGGTNLTSTAVGSGADFEGRLREDVTDPTSPGYVAQVPADFIAQLKRVLYANGIDTAIFTTGDLEQIAQQAWVNPFIQHAWANRMDFSATGSIESLISNQLFAASSTAPDLRRLGVQLEANAGQTLTSSEQAILSGGGTDPLVASTEQVPNPFGQFTTVSGNDYGQAVDPNSISGGYGPIHLGVDYGTPEGTLIAAPFAGTVTVQRGVPDYGNKVTLTLSNGYYMVFGHVADGLANGPVQPGQIIARSGANVGDSQGAVTLVEWHAPDGSFLNPHDVLDPIQKGTTFAELEPTLGQGIAGTGITHSAALDSEFPGAKNIFVQYFGRLPTDAELVSLATAGGPNQDVKSMEDYVRSLPSHIPGMLEGQYFDARNEADKVSMAALGHLSTDGIVKELFDSGQTNPKDIQNWYDTHSPNQIDKATYNAIYAANQPHLAAIYNESGFDPRIAIAQAGQAGHIAPPATDQALAAASLPVPTMADTLTVPFQTKSGYVTDTPPPPEPVAHAKPVMSS